jgi:hypothetical protein
MREKLTQLDGLLAECERRAPELVKDPAEVAEFLDETRKFRALVEGMIAAELAKEVGPAQRAPNQAWPQ